MLIKKIVVVGLKDSTIIPKQFRDIGLRNIDKLGDRPGALLRKFSTFSEGLINQKNSLSGATSM
jgi:hypothetical protein